MYLSTNWANAKNLKVSNSNATVYENRGDGYKDHPDETATWLHLEAGTETVHLRLTWEQLESLQHATFAMLRDHDEALIERAKAAPTA